jgi:hypothetical protein
VKHLLHLAAAVVAAIASPAAARGQDPAVDKFVAATDRRLAEHPFLGRLKLIKVLKHSPIVFYLKPPDGEDRQYEAKVVNTYLPFLKGVQRVFEAQYAGPAGLRRKPEAPAFAIVVLHSRGDYLNFAQQLDDPSMHWLRAHYDPKLQFAVTYEDTYAQDTEDAKRGGKHAILHEFVHALQHAYGSGDTLPAAPWFNEGLADYRANCTHVASSLEEPPTHPVHMFLMAQVYAGNRLRPLKCSLQEMVAATSYADVVKTVRRRFAQADVLKLMGVFYAQAEMFTRFAHEVEAGKHRARYLDFMKEVQGGRKPIEAFQAVFGQDGVFGKGGAVDFEALEQQFADWVRRMVTVDPKANAASLAGGAGEGSRPAPSTKFELGRLAWQPADARLRIAAARRFLADGAYERGLALLPADTEVAANDQALLRRERDRVQALLGLRTAVVADLVKGRRALPAVAPRQGKVMCATGQALVLQAGNEEVTVGLEILTPKVLLAEGKRLKLIGGEESAQRWLEAWLRWLDRQPVATLAKVMAGEHSRFVDLRADLAATLTAESGSEGHLLLAAQEAGLPDDPQAAANALARLEPLARAGAKGLSAARRADFEEYLHALAERAFEPNSPAALGVPGLEALPDGRVRSQQEARPGVAPVGFAVSASAMLAMDGLPNLAYDGPPALRAGDKAFELIGSGVLEWAFPLAGAQVFELEFSAPQKFVGAVALCAQEGTGAILTHLDGSLAVIDFSTDLRDSPGKAKPIFADRRYTLRIEHDGRKVVRVTVGGKETAKAEYVGSLVRGNLCLRTHTSTPLLVHRLLVEGEPVVADVLALRQKFVEDTLKRFLP